MENPEEVLQSLDEFAKLKPKDIPRELEDYLSYVAKTGDPVYQWSIVKCLFREKLLNVITDFYETCPTIDLPPCPNVDPFNYETMKSNLLERIDSFVNAPFTVQRLCELLTTPRKEYSRVDKFMRAIEKNILVVSTREPGNVRRADVMQPDFLMNGVEAIETVSIDGVNLMHNDDTEVNISDSDSIRMDCDGTEEIDMEDHPDVDTTVDGVWDKDRETSVAAEDECVKNYEGGGEPEIENESKANSESSKADDVTVETKDLAPSDDITTETFNDVVASEQGDVKVEPPFNKDEETESNEVKDIPATEPETKSSNESEDDAVTEEKSADDDAEDLVSVTNSSVTIEPESKDSLEAKSDATSLESKDDHTSSQDGDEKNEMIPETTSSACEPQIEVNNSDASNSEGDITSREPAENDHESAAENKDVTVADTVDEISPLESLQEVTSNISPPVVKDPVESVVVVNNIDVSEADTTEVHTKKACGTSVAESVVEQCDTSSTDVESVTIDACSIMETEQDERMEVDVSQSSDASSTQRDEPMDQSEQSTNVGTES